MQITYACYAQLVHTLNLLVGNYQASKRKGRDSARGSRHWFAVPSACVRRHHRSRGSEALRSADLLSCGVSSISNSVRVLSSV